MTVITAQSLSLTFATNDGSVHALKDVSLTVNKGDPIRFIGQVLRNMAIVLTFATFATIAHAQTWPIPGIYGDAGGCDMAAGRPLNTDIAFVLRPNSIDRYETSCDFTAVTAADGLVTKIETMCFGEGEEWPQSFILSGTPGKDGYRISPADAPEIIFTLRPCN